MKQFFLLLILITINGCSSLGYYWQAMNGHAELLNRQRPFTEVLQDDATRIEVKQRIQLASEIRQFANRELRLPDNNSYTHYADLERPYALWNVVATPEYSLQTKQWCFVFVGCLSYRGYYEEQEARDYAQVLQQQGYDVTVSGARAYSTLGWFDDPLLNTMLYKSDARLAGIIFHELAHQQLYKKDASAINEAFAMAVEIEGVIRWLGRQNRLAEVEDYRRELKQQLEFNQLLRSTRDKLKRLYASNIDNSQKALDKAWIFRELKQQYADFKQRWDGDSSYDDWMSQQLNNAHLALVGTYYDYVPMFRKLFRDNGGDFARFYQVVDKMSIAQIEALYREQTKLAIKQK